MKLHKMIAPAAVLAALTLIAAPAQAQRRGGDNRGRSAVRSSTVERSRAGNRNRSPDRPRFDQRAGSVNTQRRGGGYAQTSRGTAAPRVAPYGMTPRAGDFNRRRTIVIDPYRYRTFGARSYGYRPYSFRPRFRIGIGVSAGYPVPYPYYDPYAYPAYDPYAYPPPPSGPGYSVPNAPVSAPAGAVGYGGVSFEITPGQAAVYADGAYVGPVSDFSDASRPLSLSAGEHRIEVQAPGFAPMAFDVTIEPGEVIPYRGDLQPIR
jgi:hypothetical protein